MKLPSLTRFLPTWKNAALAAFSAVLLILAFPDFDLWYLAWFGLAPLMWAIERQKGSAAASAVLGWLWGFIFFTGTCWWLTFAPITYAGFPWALAYFLLLCVTAVVAIFPALFALLLSVMMRRLGDFAMLFAPFVWVLTEFLRYWITGNNWNAMGYSVAFGDASRVGLARFGGVLLVSFYLLFWNTGLVFALLQVARTRRLRAYFLYYFVGLTFFWFMIDRSKVPEPVPPNPAGTVVAIQPNVPMSGLNYDKWQQLRTRHVELAESALASNAQNPQSAIRHPQSTTVIFPESPMNFMYEEDQEFRDFVHRFAAKNDVSVLFNSAEPDTSNDKYFNSAVLVGPDGREVAQYDKIYLLPFGESVPAPLQSIVPAFVGSFSYGKEYDLLPLGEAKAGVMICFESHFGELSSEYVRNGADVLIEMTNDGYLGPTPVLKQHLANAVFRAVETNRPVLRVTNVGVTTYVDERGTVRDPAESYTEATRTWTIGKSDGKQTFYVRYGDWFAWLCSILSLLLLIVSLWRRPPESLPATGG